MAHGGAAGCCCQLRTSNGTVVKGIESILRYLASTLPCTSDRQRQALWPSSGPMAVAMSRTIAVVEPLYFRTLQYVLSLLTPLMKTWEARLAEIELQHWDEARRAKLSAREPEEGKGDAAGAGTCWPTLTHDNATLCPGCSVSCLVLRRIRRLYHRRWLSGCPGLSHGIATTWVCCEEQVRQQWTTSLLQPCPSSSS